jgi:HK97 family phage portal protein
MGFAKRLSTWAGAAIKAVSGFPAEGQYRPGPWYLPVTHGWLPADVGNSLNWWQNGYTPILQSAQLSIIEACVGAYSQTMAMCPGDHWRSKSNGGRERVTNSSLCRILRYPNDYQSMSDFLLNAVRQLYLQGNAYALCIRNSRFEITELHLMDNRYCRALIDGSGEVHYSLGGNWVIENRIGPLATVPQRDVLHIKLHCDQLRNPLIGQTPLAAAYLDTAMGQSIKEQQFIFYQRQAKPGFVLSTDLTLEKDQVSALRDRWTEQTTGANTGGTPILTGGLKPQQIPVTSWRDAQLAELLKLTDQDIAMAFRVPPQIIGIPAHSTHGTTEAMMRSWIATGFGFCINHVEEAFGLTFGLKGQPDDYVEFSTDILLRSDFKDRIDGLTKAVVGGIFSPNEARNQEDLPNVPFGDEPRVQQQVVPLSAAGKIPASPAAPPAPPAPKAPEEPQRSLNADARRNSFARILLNRSRQLEREQQRRISGRVA